MRDFSFLLLNVLSNLRISNKLKNKKRKKGEPLIIYCYEIKVKVEAVSLTVFKDFAFKGTSILISIYIMY